MAKGPGSGVPERKGNEYRRRERFAATGKSIHGSAFTLFRFSDGKIAEEWRQWDSTELLRQLGLVECRRAVTLKP